MKTLRSSALFAAASLLVAGTASAGNYYWDSNGTASGIGATTGSFNWDTSSAIWSTTATGTDAASHTFDNTDKAIFGTSASASLSSGGVTVALGQAVTLNTIQFGKGTSSAFYTISANTLTFDGTAPTIDTTLSLASGIGQISSAIIGTAGFKKTGNATLQINGDLSGLSGVIDVSTGTISLNSLASLGSTATINMAGGTTLRSSSSGARTIANDITLNGNVTMGASSTGAIKLSGKVTLASGSATLANAGAITLNGTSVLDLGSFFNGQADGSTYQLITGTGTTTGNFSAIRFTGATNFDTVNFDNTTGKLTFTLTAVPEPPVYGLLGAGAIIAAVIRRRRKAPGTRV